MTDTTKNEKNPSLTLLLPAGELPGDMMAAVSDLVGRFNLRVYLTTAQNMRLMGIRPEDLEGIKGELAALGAEFKRPGHFPIPKVCVGKRDCNLGIVDSMGFSKRIVEHFRDRTMVKPKIKIAVAGCPASCSGALLTDIGVLATRAGYDIYAGGKGGPNPQVGRRIVRKADEAQVLAVIAALLDFHDAKTPTKQRMFKLLSDPEFPFPEAV